MEAEARQVRIQFRLTAAVALTTLVTGAVFFHIVEHLKWLDAFYFCTVTLTTVGYGDIVPKTDAGKLFDMFYILIGIGILATFAQLVVKNIYLRRQVKQSEKAK